MNHVMSNENNQQSGLHATEPFAATPAPAEPHVHEEHDDHVAAVAPMAGKGRWIVLAGVLALALGGGFYWFRASKTPVPEKTPTSQSSTPAAAAVPPDVVLVEEKELKQITVEPVIAKTITVEQETTGKVAFNEDRMTPVFTPYAGRVVDVLVNKGDVVKAGQPMLIVEAPDYVTAQNDLSAARAEVDKSKIAVDAAQKIVDRLRLLYQREAVATKDVQAAEADLARAREELNRDEAAVVVAKNKLALFGKEPKEIDDLEKHLPEKLERRITIRAPLAGTIVERKVGPGEYVKPDMPDPLFLLSDLSTLWVMADVYESFLPHIRVGTPVQISTAAFPDRYFPARISFINPTVDPATRTIHVRCVVPNRGNALKPEMFAKIKIGEATPTPVPAVPTSAVLSQNNASYVLVEQSPTRFQRRTIKPGREVDGYLTIDEGLKLGERVVTKGVLLLNNGVGKTPEKDVE